MIKFIKYEDQVRAGITLTRHDHNCEGAPHFHAWIDLGRWCLEITVPREKTEHGESPA